MLFGATTVSEIMSLASDADASDAIDSLWVGDSIFAKPRPDSLTLLGALAGVTDRVTLGVGCMASFTIRDPIIFSHQWASLDLFSGGRMLLAACTGLVAGGASAREGEHWGVTDSQRPARLEENIELCRRLWAEDNVSFSGEFNQCEGVTIEPKPVQDPCPIWIASNPNPSATRQAVVDRALRRVARLADGWMTVRMFPNAFAGNWNKIKGFLVEEGKVADDFPNMAYHNINLNPDRTAALEETQRFLNEYYGPVFSPPMIEAWTASGTPEECIEHLNGLVAEGAKTITLRITSWDQRGQYQQMIEDVIPYVGQDV